MVFGKYLVAGGAAAAVLCGGVAFAHVSMTKVGFANQSQVLTFGVGHGCEGADTYRLEVSIPKEVTVVRAVPNGWGKVSVEKNDEGIITSVVWEKETVEATDDFFYEAAIRIRVPDAPFTTLLFPALQNCRNADGEEFTANWNATPEEVEEAGESEEVLEAPKLTILPPRVPGWNKYTVKNKVTDLAVFADAQIVWAGDAAYSANPATAELIKGEEDVEELTEIPAGAEVWVKY